MSWLTFVGHGSNINLVYKAFVMLRQCYFAHPTCMLPKWQDCTPHSGEGKGHLLVTAGWGWKPGFAQKPGWEGMPCCMELWGTHGRRANAHGLSCLITAGQGEGGAPPTDLGQEGAAPTTWWGQKSRCHPQAQPGHFPPARQ